MKGFRLCYSNNSQRCYVADRRSSGKLRVLAHQLAHQPYFWLNFSADPHLFSSNADFSYLATEISAIEISTAQPRISEDESKNPAEPHIFSSYGEAFRTFGFARTLVFPKIYIVLFFLARYVFDTLGKGF